MASSPLPRAARLRLLTLAIAAGALAGLLLVARLDRLLVDERWYGMQIEWFLGRRYELIGGITMLPGYFAAMAAALSPLGDFNDHAARSLNLVVGLALVPFSLGLARSAWPQAAEMKAAQAFFQPLLFPFFFLVYTEAWSLAALAGMLLATFRHRFWLAALAGLAGTAMRQDFIAWVATAYALAALEGWEGRASIAALARRGWDAARQAYPLLLVLLAFAAFVAWNGAIAMGDRSVHESGINLTNLYFFLLCAWLVFLPQNLEALPRIARRLRDPRVAIALVAAFAAYLATYSNTHPYNQEHLRFFLRNEALYWMTREPLLRAALFVPMAWTALMFLSTPLAEPRHRLLLAVAPLAIVLHPLIEQRYYLPAMFLFTVWRAPLAPRWERATLGIWIAAGLLLLWGMCRGKFFL